MEDGPLKGIPEVPTIEGLLDIPKVWPLVGLTYLGRVVVDAPPDSDVLLND